MTKRRVIVRRKKYVPPTLPDKPKVTIGPRSYGLSKKGNHICCRFFVTQTTIHVTSAKGGINAFFKKNGLWFVVDMKEGDIAEGTKESGYSKKKEAVTVAREYRDEFGAWATMPF